MGAGDAADIAILLRYLILVSKSQVVRWSLGGKAVAAAVAVAGVFLVVGKERVSRDE